MDIQLGAKGFELRENLETYTTEKIEHLQKYLPGIRTARVELVKEKTRASADQNMVQVTLNVQGATLRVEERAATFQAAVDAATLALRKQLERFKGKVYRAEQRGRRKMKEAGLVMEREERSPIMRRKSFSMKPVTPEEAIEEMEGLDHAFYFFMNLETGTYSVVYRRKAGGYGLIEPANP
ncbi:MAG: ribosome-associated translation inhibitor RaiA [Chloroflexi bacterium]|nr:ribosome-associated translation inhibitor RaiA [Chloroflexota bacterium]